MLHLLEVIVTAMVAYISQMTDCWFIWLPLIVFFYLMFKQRFCIIVERKADYTSQVKAIGSIAWCFILPQWLKNFYNGFTVILKAHRTSSENIWFTKNIMASPHSNVRAIIGQNRWTLSLSRYGNTEVSGQSPATVTHSDWALREQ